MAPRTSWRGFLKLSLVSVPVRAFTANNTSEEVRLNQLHKDCNSRVKYKKVCLEHGELKPDEIVSGYEYSKDQYVVIDPEEIANFRAQSDKAVHIDGFLPPSEVDPTYFAGKTHYLLPDGVAGDRAYALLQRGMFEADVVAMAKVVLSGREQLVLLRPVDDMLVMSVVNYAKRIKSLETFRSDLPEVDTTPEELALANTLIEASRLKDFDLAKYEDDYGTNLKKLIQMKVDGEEIVEAPDHEEPKIINLMDALKRSVAEAQATSGKKMAPSAKSKAATKKKAPAKRKKTG